MRDTNADLYNERPHAQGISPISVFQDFFGGRNTASLECILGLSGE